jgi:hypothetical protein
MRPWTGKPGDAYELPDSALWRWLRTVQARVRAALDTGPPGPLRVISVCAGQGRDLLDVLDEHPRRDDVTARLVELEPRNAALAEHTAKSLGVGRIEVVVGDAGLTTHYRGMVPADLVLLCGVFGNLTDQDVERTVAYCPQLCKTGGTVVWTRHRRPPDQVPRICQWLRERGTGLSPAHVHLRRIRRPDPPGPRPPPVVQEGLSRASCRAVPAER